MKASKKITDLKKSYPLTFEKSMIASLLLVISIFHFVPAPKPQYREQKISIPGFIVEDVPVTRQGVRPRIPNKPAVPIPVDDPSMAEDETIDPTLINWDLGAFYGEGGFGATEIPILPPRPLIQVMPEYPGEDKKKGVSGKVVLSIKVNTFGIVTAVVVMENTTGSELCVKAAIAAAKKCRYIPAQRGRMPVTTWTTCSYGFHPQI